MTCTFGWIRIQVCAGAGLAAAMCMTSRVDAVETVTPDEMQQKTKWIGQHLLDPTPQLPFSFIYDGQASAALLASWPKSAETKRLDDARSQHTFTWNDLKTGLSVRCVAVEYADFPVAEWTVYLKNTGTGGTPILENIQGLNATFRRDSSGEFVLHGNHGDWMAAEGYGPYEHTLSPDVVMQFAPDGGRPTNGPKGWPYYNVQMPGGGFILAVGWPGQWASSFVRDGQDGLRIVAGQELTHLSLKPGEQVRTPLIAVLFWQGTDVVRSQNIWRHWMLAHNLPRPGGGPLKSMFFACCTGIFSPTLKTTEAIERQFIDAFAKEGIKFDYWWVDAGWYPCNSWPDGRGTWEHDQDRFPNGLRPVSDYAHAKGAKFILWFEPERVESGTWLAQNHPEWVHNGLLDLGNPAAWSWLVEHVDKLIAEYGVDLYRQDFNMDPLSCWRSNDAPDRQGMTENLHVQGYLAYWDELQRRHPGLPIDSCAAGGRRNDLETLRRSAGPHTRSDYIAFDGNPDQAPGNQGQTYGISSWFPYYGQGVYYFGQTARERIYNVRSYMGPAFGICVDVRRPDVDWDLYRRMVSQWRQVADCMLGDYYPLTPYSLRAGDWIAWQFDRPEYGDGMIQAFRRDQCKGATRVFHLCGLDSTAQYEITDLDVGAPVRRSGKDLMENGLIIEIKNRPGAALIAYKRTK
jgi:alpha-galactosidase